MGDLLKDRVAVVTGAGRGLGRAIALLMADEGARVVVNDLGGTTTGAGASTNPADEVVAEIKGKGGMAVASYDSVTTMQGGENIIKAALDTFGKIDVLINNAGILRDRMIWNMTEEEWDTVIAVHLKGHFTCTKFASILMRQQRYGRIVNTSSRAALGNPGQANYSAAKGGILGLTRTVARDLGRYGVTCNAIMPSARTRLMATIPDSTRQRRATETAASATAPATGVGVPLEQLPPPEAVAPLAVYLASERAANVNGQVFFAGGPVITLYSHPQPVSTIFARGEMWTVKELATVFDNTVGKGLVNPAPPQAPQQS